MKDSLFLNRIKTNEIKTNEIVNYEIHLFSKWKSLLNVEAILIEILSYLELIEIQLQMGLICKYFHRTIENVRIPLIIRKSLRREYVPNGSLVRKTQFSKLIFENYAPNLMIWEDILRTATFCRGLQELCLDHSPYNSLSYSLFNYIKYLGNTPCAINLKKLELRFPSIPFLSTNEFPNLNQLNLFLKRKTKNVLTKSWPIEIDDQIFDKEIYQLCHFIKNSKSLTHLGITCSNEKDLHLITHSLYDSHVRTLVLKDTQGSIFNDLYWLLESKRSKITKLSFGNLTKDCHYIYNNNNNVICFNESLPIGLFSKLDNYSLNINITKISLQNIKAEILAPAILCIGDSHSHINEYIPLLTIIKQNLSHLKCIRFGTIYSSPKESLPKIFSALSHNTHLEAFSLRFREYEEDEDDALYIAKGLQIISSSLKILDFSGRNSKKSTNNENAMEINVSKICSILEQKDCGLTLLLTSNEKRNELFAKSIENRYVNVRDKIISVEFFKP